MQVCKNCGMPVKYIACGYNKIAVCNAGPVEIITESGHKNKGYTPHICTDKQQVNERNND